MPVIRPVRKARGSEVPEFGAVLSGGKDLHFIRDTPSAQACPGPSSALAGRVSPHNLGPTVFRPIAHGHESGNGQNDSTFLPAAPVVGTTGSSLAIPAAWLPRGTVPPPVQEAPLGAHIGVLGKKWTLLILRDVASQQSPSFSQILKAHSRMSRRILSMRLRELQREGYLLRFTSETNPRRTAYVLSEKGRDTIPVLNAVCDLVQRHGMVGPIPRSGPGTTTLALG